MKLKHLMIFTSGVAVPLMVGLVSPKGDTAPVDLGPAVQIAADSSKSSTQRGGTKPKPSTDSGDGFGSLYAATTYRISTEGCEPGEVRIVRDISQGLGASMFPNQSDCVMYTYQGPSGERKGSFGWQGGLSFSWPQSPKLYVQDTSGPDQTLIGFDDLTLPAGQSNFFAYILFSDLVFEPDPRIFFFFSFDVREDDTRTELELATEITTRFATDSVVSAPIIVYSLPTAGRS